MPLYAAEFTEDQSTLSGALDDKEDFESSSREIVKRSKVSVMNMLRSKLADPSSGKVSERFAGALSIETEGVPRKEWETKLITQLALAVEQLLKQTQNGLDWPSYYFSVEGGAVAKISNDGKVLELPGEPTVNLVGSSFPVKSPALEHTAEAGPLRLHFGIIDASVTPGKIGWQEKPAPGGLAIGNPMTASFVPRYLLDLTFTVSLADSSERIEGGGSIAFEGSARTLELRPLSDTGPSSEKGGRDERGIP